MQLIPVTIDICFNVSFHSRGNTGRQLTCFYFLLRNLNFAINHLLFSFSKISDISEIFFFSLCTYFLFYKSSFLPRELHLR